MPTLFWDEQGEIACDQHAPHRGSDTRADGRWRRITLREAGEFEREIGRGPACETCASIARRHGEGLHAETKSAECALCAEVAS